MQYTEKELAQLIEKVESEFSTYLGKSEAASAASLNKGEDGKDKKPADKKPESKEAPKADAPPADDKAAAPAPEAKPAEAAPAAPADAAAAPAADHGYDDEDMQHMDAMYASMSPAELKAHHDSIRRALDAQAPAAAAPAPEAAPAAAPAAGAPPMGKSEKGASEVSDENPTLNSKPKAGGKDMDSDPKNGGIEGQQPSGSPGAKSPASDASKANQMAKAEHARRNGGKIEDSPPRNSPGAKSPASKAEGVQMDKSEKTEVDLIKAELDAEKVKSADLKKNFDAAQEFLTKLVGKIGAPKGKAITEIAALQKNEGEGVSEMSKSEITQVLLKKSADPNLSKADREAINSFYLNKTDISTINHLLKN